MHRLLAGLAIGLVALLSAVLLAAPTQAASETQAYVEKGEDGSVICFSGIGDYPDDFVEVITAAGKMNLVCQFRNTGITQKKATREGVICSIYDGRTGVSTFTSGHRLIAPNGNIVLTCHL